MDIVKHALIFFATLVLISCGGDSGNSDPTEIIFPEHLPKVNPNLSQENQSGTWMVYRIQDVNYSLVKDDVEVEVTSQLIDEGISVINFYNSEIATLPFCTLYDMYEQFELEITPTSSGYKQSYSTNPNAISVPSGGSLKITFIDNNKLVGKGNRIQTYINTTVNTSTTIYAVKISDSTNLNASSDFSYSSNIETESHLEVDRPAICIALSSFNSSYYYSDSNKTSNNHGQLAQIFSIDEDNLYGMEVSNAQGMEIFGAPDVPEKEEYQRIGGFYFNEQDDVEWSQFISCPLEDTDCLTYGTLDFNIIKNDKMGIVFNTRLNIIGGSFLNSEVSLIIDPIENEE